MTTHKKDVMDREKELTTYLVNWNISFNPPMKGASLENMKSHNPEGYAMLMEFLALKEAQKKAKENEE